MKLKQILQADIGAAATAHKHTLAGTAVAALCLIYRKESKGIALVAAAVYICIASIMAAFHEWPRSPFFILNVLAVPLQWFWKLAGLGLGIYFVLVSRLPYGSD